MEGELVYHPWLRLRLSVHFFLCFAVLGAWQPVLAKHLHELGFDGIQIALIYAAGSMAALVGPLQVGQVADRWVPAERLLAVNGLGAGLLLLVAASRTDFASLFPIMLGAALFWVTAIPLSASLAFRHLGDAPRKFPGVRLWGTVGFVVGGWLFTGWLYLDSDRSLGDCLTLGGSLALLSGLYSLTLPHTPPHPDRSGGSAMGKAVGMLRDRSFLVFVVLLFFIHGMAAFSFLCTAVFLRDDAIGVAEADLSAVMSIGQITEIPAVLLLSVLYLKLGIRGTMALGMLAWALRYVIFSVGEPRWLVIGALCGHGLYFAWVRIAATIYVERICPSDVRASAQGLTSLIVDGGGLLTGALVAGLVTDFYTVNRVSDWTAIWGIPAIGVGVGLILFLLVFRPSDRQTSESVRA